MPADLNLRDLMVSWCLHMRAERKSPRTIRTYSIGVRQYLDWLSANGRQEAIDRDALRAWIAEQLDNGAEAASVVSRQLAVRRFSAWLATEGEIPADPLVGIKPPKIDVKVVPVLTDDQLAALVKVCHGKDFRDRRDEAIIRLMAESGVRAEELVSLRLDDLDLANGQATVRRGKGGKGRIVAIGPTTAAALDRYIRARRTHRLAETHALWLGSNGQTFGYFALRDMVRRRGEQAGVEHLHPHMLRHTWASRWLSRGGSEGGLMSAAGWSQRRMVDRYSAATAQQRAIEEAKRLSLGEI